MREKYDASPLLFKEHDPRIDAQPQVNIFFPLCDGLLHDSGKQKIRSPRGITGLGSEVKHVNGIVLRHKFGDVKGKEIPVAGSRLEDRSRL
jgi:hypothetical protein